MAVANPYVYKTWDEWKAEMEEIRTKGGRERAEGKVSDDEDEGEEEEEESEADREEDEGEEEGMEMRVAEEMEDSGELGVQEMEKEEDIDVRPATKAEEVAEGKEEGGNELEREVNEDMDGNEEDSDTKEAGAMEEEQGEGDDLVDREVIDNVVDADEEMEVMEEEEEELENEFDWLVEENGEVDDVEERELTDTEELGEEQEGEREGKWEVEEAEELEEGAGEGENESDIEVSSNEEVDEDEQEEYQEQEQIGQFREQIRVERRGVQLNQESTMQENRTNNEEVNLSGSVKSDYEESDLMGSEDKCFNFERKNDKQYKEPQELEVPDSIPELLASKERREEEDRSEKLRNETVATQEEESQDDHQNVQDEEDESTEDEDAEQSDEDEADDDEDVVKIYCKDDYFADVFRTLTEYRDSSLLTDLTLSTKDGASFKVHSPVLAAVSSLIWEILSRGNMGNMENMRVSTWSLSLGPEVNRVGLEAVVEFAYTGLISRLSEDTVCQIKAAAQALGTQRVLDLCTVEEEKSRKTGGKRKEEKISAAEQMLISLQSMKELWMDKRGCDVILEAAGGSLHVHRVILAGGNDYFRSMFTLGMKESNELCVALPFLLASELEILIGCSYSGALPLSWKNIFEITTTALQLQYQPALSLCLNFLNQEINPYTCLDVASFAEAYEIVQLLEVADDFVLRQFQKVACTPKFKDLPAKKLLKYLNSLSLCVPSELVVFKAVVAWIQAQPKKRLKLTKELMKTIHFPLMTFKEFKEVQSLNMWSNQSLADLFEAIFEDFCSSDIAPHSLCRIYLPKESLVLIGGDQTFEDQGRRSISRELWFGNSLRNHMGIRKAMEWRKLGEMPEPARFSHEVSVLKGQLYLFGGKKYYGINDTLNSVFRYDPLQNTWESLAEMKEKRSSFSVVVLDGKMLAIGGHCDPDYRDSVEQYCPTANSWSFTCPLDLPLGGHVAKVFRGQIFVSGGLNNDYQCVSSMFLYHPEKGSTYLANMAKPRANHCMEILGEFLYVAGGITTGESMTVVDQLACEVYSPAYDSWTAITSLPVPHVGAGSAVLEGKFYVLGGYSHEDCRDIKRVHRYDPSAYSWENMGRMPGPNSDIRASLLCLPQHFRL
uniref:kelch-like protein 13 n=1 Tax=Semicossyphus pulcher TaxID=241346 RepID=UPI0037E901D1